ncbi:hypothetical protein EYF80_020050 [Liparis tanakae]|uniref:Uncharacterized protein n=1 Tax=Liparis tanakae TaxID=230148 RepID=A0A4Z2HV09_9TELE|nr:hypothetical protein EYF80_020050 [Liparis tanakae]
MRMEEDSTQRMKDMVGAWNRLVQESSYLECSGSFGVISEQRAAGRMDEPADGDRTAIWKPVTLPPPGTRTRHTARTEGYDLSTWGGGHRLEAWGSDYCKCSGGGAWLQTADCLMINKQHSALTFLLETAI